MCKMTKNIFEVLNSLEIFDVIYAQELFAKIDKEDDGAIYLSEIVLHMRAMNEDIDSNLEVNR